MPIDSSGPYLTAAALCEKVLKESDGVVSLIRIVDRFMVSGNQGAPEQMPPITIQTTGVFMFKAGMARGTSNFTLMLETPTGDEHQLGSMTILFEGEDRGNNIILNLSFQVRHEGLYWIAVIIDNVVLTRVPLRILYQRIVGPSLH
jgi:hypothetical protein